MIINKGFTLIELMIVIAILGIVFAIVSPVFQNKNSNVCTVETVSKYYVNVDRNSIIRDSEIISFRQNNKVVEVSAYNTDIVCNGY